MLVASVCARSSRSFIAASASASWPFFGLWPAAASESVCLIFAAAAVAVVGEPPQRRCSAAYAESSHAEPDASAFVSAISVSVANWPTLELICVVALRQVGRRRERARHRREGLRDHVTVRLVVVAQAGQLRASSA